LTGEKEQEVSDCLDKKYQIWLKEIPNPTLEQFNKVLGKPLGLFSPIILKEKLKAKDSTFTKAKNTWVAKKKIELKPELTINLEQEILKAKLEDSKLSIEERNKNIAKLDRDARKDELSKKMVRSASYPLIDDEE
jgi:hypothetical protein